MMDDKITVHNTQKVFRLILQSMAYAGRPVQIPDEVISLYTNSLLFPATMEVLKTLLDINTGFYCGMDDMHTIQEIQILTSAHREIPEAADFVIIPGDIPLDAMENAPRIMEQAKIGTIYDPHASATILIECASVSHGTVYRCEGPGIDNNIQITIDCAWDWAAIRRLKNVEFPLGIDCIFIDSAARVLSLPRTTRVTKQILNEVA